MQKSMRIYCQCDQQMAHTNNSSLFLTTPENGLHSAQNKGRLFQPNPNCIYFSVLVKLKYETKKHLSWQ